MAWTLGQAAAAVYLGACRTPRAAPRLRTLALDDLRLVITAYADAGFVVTSAPAAVARLDRFGLRPRGTVELRVHDGIAPFVRATGRTEPWVRAWSTFDVVHLLPPRLWRDPGPAAQLERVTHELCHVATFRALGDEPTATRIGVPFWFREGVASVVAAQAARRLPLAEVKRRAAGRDPLRDPPDALTAYAAAHHAMALLVERHGEQVFAHVLRAARDDGERGAIVRALPRTTGLTLDELWARSLTDA